MCALGISRASCYVSTHHGVSMLSRNAVPQLGNVDVPLGEVNLVVDSVYTVIRTPGSAMMSTLRTALTAKTPQAERAQLPFALSM